MWAPPKSAPSVLDGFLNGDIKLLNGLYMAIVEHDALQLFQQRGVWLANGGELSSH